MALETTEIASAAFDPLSLLVVLLASAALLVAMAPNIVRHPQTPVVLPNSGMLVTSQPEVESLHQVAKRTLLLTVTLISVISLVFGIILFWIEVFDHQVVSATDLSNVAFIMIIVNLTMSAALLAIWLWNSSH